MGTPQDNTSKLVASMEATAKHTKRTADAVEKIARHTGNMNLILTIWVALICLGLVIWMFSRYFNH